MPLLLQKLAMPLQPHRPASFYSFSPEADLLRKTAFFILSWVVIKSMDSEAQDDGAS
ncbi:hypothetical protein [Mucilaginibacter rubeus]|uniref:hypothetical protein n=1 Tax=Mucilaginibacter rubeus TaxID=2027860 RepID=UPI001668BD1D